MVEELTRGMARGTAARCRNVYARGEGRLCRAVLQIQCSLGPPARTSRNMFLMSSADTTTSPPPCRSTLARRCSFTTSVIRRKPSAMAICSRRGRGAGRVQVFPLTNGGIVRGLGSGGARREIARVLVVGGDGYESLARTSPGEQSKSRSSWQGEKADAHLLVERQLCQLPHAPAFHALVSLFLLILFLGPYHLQVLRCRAGSLRDLWRRPHRVRPTAS